MHKGCVGLWTQKWGGHQFQLQLTEPPWPCQPCSDSTEWYSMMPLKNGLPTACRLSHAQTSADFISTRIDCWPALLNRALHRDSSQVLAGTVIWWDWNVNEASRRVYALVKQDYALMLTAADTESIVILRGDSAKLGCRSLICSFVDVELRKVEPLCFN